MNTRPLDWILAFDPNGLEDQLYVHAKRCLLDLLGVAAGASTTQVAAIARRYVIQQHAGRRPLLFADTTASPTGMALHGAWMIDALDAHDGQSLTKGHAGVALLPGLMALPEVEKISGRAFLGLLVLGYEIATRAGIALHASACDYHASGAWNALGVAGMLSKLIGLGSSKLHEALGIAEFYGPRSQMIRYVGNPTMVKDGSGWGAMGGVAAALLAKDGFTGAPAVTVVGENSANIWADLGERWYLFEQYFKAYPICRWAHPAVEAVLSLRSSVGAIERIEKIEIYTFHEAACLATAHPSSTDQAQYSLPWPVACALKFGTVDIDSVTRALSDSLLHTTAERVTMKEEEHYNALFPAERWAHAVITLDDGAVLSSTSFEARGNPTNPLSDDEIIYKYHQLSDPVLGACSQTIRKTVEKLELRSASDLLKLLW